MYLKLAQGIRGGGKTTTNVLLFLQSGVKQFEDMRRQHIKSGLKSTHRKIVEIDYEIIKLKIAIKEIKGE